MEQAHGFELNIGDIIYQLFSFGVVIAVIVLLIVLFNNNRKQKRIIEDKLNSIDDKLGRLTNDKKEGS